MTLVRFDLGQTADIPSLAEHRGLLRGELEALERSRERGVKLRHLPVLQGTLGGTATLGHAAPVCGPEPGYIWSVMALLVTGLTASGTAPDIINFFLNDTVGGNAPVWWQLNGNSFGETFGRGQRLIFGGETLLARAGATFAATGTITVTGDVLEVPAEMQGKLV